MPSISSVLQQPPPGVEPLRVCLQVLLCSTMLAVTKTRPVNRFSFSFWDKFSPSSPGWPGTCLYKPGLPWTHRDNVYLCLSSANIINTFLKGYLKKSNLFFQFLFLTYIFPNTVGYNLKAYDTICILCVPTESVKMLGVLFLNYVYEYVCMWVHAFKYRYLLDQKHQVLLKDLAVAISHLMWTLLFKSRMPS